MVVEISAVVHQRSVLPIQTMADQENQSIETAIGLLRGGVKMWYLSILILLLILSQIYPQEESVKKNIPQNAIYCMEPEKVQSVHVQKTIRISVVQKKEQGTVINHYYCLREDYMIANSIPKPDSGTQIVYMSNSKED